MKIRFRCEIPVYKKLSFTDSGISKSEIITASVKPIKNKII